MNNCKLIYQKYWNLSFYVLEPDWQRHPQDFVMVSDFWLAIFHIQFIHSLFLLSPVLVNSIISSSELIHFSCFPWFHCNDVTTKGVSILHLSSAFCFVLHLKVNYPNWFVLFSLSTNDPTMIWWTSERFSL